MAELWPFIQSLVKKWKLEGRIFTFRPSVFPSKLVADFQLLTSFGQEFYGE